MKSSQYLSLLTSAFLILFLTSCGKATEKNDWILGKWACKGHCFMGWHMCQVVLEFQPDEKFALSIINSNSNGKTLFYMKGTYAFPKLGGIELTSKEAKCAWVQAGSAHAETRFETGEDDPLTCRLISPDNKQLFFSNIAIMKQDIAWTISVPKHQELTKVSGNK